MVVYRTQVTHYLSVDGEIGYCIFTTYNTIIYGSFCFLAFLWFVIYEICLLYHTYLRILELKSTKTSHFIHIIIDGLPPIYLTYSSKNHMYSKYFNILGAEKKSLTVKSFVFSCFSNKKNCLHCIFISYIYL